MNRLDINNSIGNSINNSIGNSIANTRGDRARMSQSNLQPSIWAPDNCLQRLAPAANDRMEVEKLTEKLKITIRPGETIRHVDFNIPAESVKKMLMQVGLLVVVVPLICLGRIPLPALFCVTIGAVFIAALMISKSASQTNLWVITDSRVIKLNKDGVNDYPLSKIRLYGRAVEGGCIAFYMGRTTMSRVTIYFPRDPKRMLAALCEQVDCQKAK